MLEFTIVTWAKQWRPCTSNLFGVILDFSERVANGHTEKLDLAPRPGTAQGRPQGTGSGVFGLNPKKAKVTQDPTHVPAVPPLGSDGVFAEGSAGGDVQDLRGLAFFGADAACSLTGLVPTIVNDLLARNRPEPRVLASDFTDSRGNVKVLPANSHAALHTHTVSSLH
jgi:hypothetical protein